jgi:hypothetical protein
MMLAAALLKFFAAADQTDTSSQLHIMHIPAAEVI